MQVQPKIPESLQTYALATVGPYPARYDQIMDEAFTKYQLMLSTTALRQVAGGGSNSTAQEAVERFRLKLHKSLSSKIEFGADIPPDVAARMNATMSELWLACLKLASVEYEGDRQRLESVASGALAREADALAQVQTIQDSLAKEQSEHTQTRVLVEESNAREASAWTKADELTSQLNDAIASHAAEILRMQQDAREKAALLLACETTVTELRGRLSELATAQDREKAEMRQEFRLHISDQRRSHEAETSKAQQTRDKLAAELNAERSQNIEATLKMARLDQKLSITLEGLAKAQETLAKLQSEYDLAKEAHLILRGSFDELRRDKDALAVKVEILQAELAQAKAHAEASRLVAAQTTLSESTSSRQAPS